MKKVLILFLSVLTLAAFAPKEIQDVTSYLVKPEQSQIKWHGKKVTGEHFGLIKLQDGTLEMDGETLIGGNFSLDMQSITCTDLKDPGTNQKLVGHLKSDDFFGVEKYPVSSFTIKKAEKKGPDQYHLTGDLTIKGITHEISFPAQVEMSQGKLKAQAEVNVDRSKYDVRYGSKSFFDNLGDKMIYDDFTLMINLVAEDNSLSRSK